jgi:hypothetical protein
VGLLDPELVPGAAVGRDRFHVPILRSLRHDP